MGFFFQMHRNGVKMNGKGLMNEPITGFFKLKMKNINSSFDKIVNYS